MSDVTNFTHRKRSYRGLIFKAVSALLIIGCLGYVAALSRANGITGLTSTTSSGCNCHGSSNSNTTLSLSSSSGSFSMDAGATQNFTLTVENANQSAAGVDIGVKTSQTGSTSAGTLSPGTGSGLQSSSGELTHTSPKNMSSGEASFTFSWKAPNQPGTYYFQAAGNAVNSNNATSGDQWNWLTPVAITVNGVEITAPEGGEKWCVGSTQTISWTSFGVNNVKIEASSNDGANWSTLVASTSASAESWSWAIPSDQAPSSTYKIRISDASKASLNAVSSTFSILAPPSVETEPMDVVTCVGQAIGLTVGVTGGGLSFQWRFNGNDIPGATGQTYSIPSAQTNNAGKYDVVITNQCGNTTSAEATVTVNEPPTITLNPVDQAACEGKEVSFEVIAEGTDLEYQWRRNGQPLQGQNAATFTIQKVTAADAGEYTVVVSGACNPSATSTTATLTVEKTPSITQQPSLSGQYVCEFESLSLSVEAEGAGLTYQWRRNNNDIPGATNAIYVKEMVTLEDAGLYDVVVSGNCLPAATSQRVNVVIKPAAKITQQPEGATVGQGQTATLSVEAIGESLRYQWKKNGGDVAEATSATLELTDVQPADAGIYTVVVKGTCGEEESEGAELIVQPTASGPSLVLGRNEVDFGGVGVGNPASQLIKSLIRNLGDEPLEITTMEITGDDAGDFSVVDLTAPFTIEPEGARDVTLRFTPSSAGEKTATLSLESNSGTDPNQSLVLKGLGGIASMSTSATSIDFEMVEVGKTMEETVEICNDGDVPLIIDGLSVEPDNAGFELVTPPTVPTTLQPEGCLTLTVRFAPTAEGSATAAVVVTSGASQSPVSIALQGEGSPSLSAPNPFAAASTLQVVPNPTREGVVINLSLERPAPVEVRIVDLQGRTVRTISSDQLSAGEHSFRWDGRSDDGTAGAAGRYQVVVRSGDWTETMPVVLRR